VLVHKPKTEVSPHIVPIRLRGVDWRNGDIVPINLKMVLLKSVLISVPEISVSSRVLMNPSA
jgi:hypothetical protein